MIPDSIYNPGCPFSIIINSNKAAAAVAFKLEEIPATFFSLSLLIWTDKKVATKGGENENENYLGVNLYSAAASHSFTTGLICEEEVQVVFSHLSGPQLSASVWLLVIQDEKFIVVCNVWKKMSNWLLDWRFQFDLYKIFPARCLTNSKWIQVVVRIVISFCFRKGSQRSQKDDKTVQLNGTNICFMVVQFVMDLSNSWWSLMMTLNTRAIKNQNWPIN